MLIHYAPLIWLTILSSTAFIYLIYDGSALGMSMLLPFLSLRNRNKAFSLLLPVWDINQTWLVFTVAGLYGGFSLGFSVVMSELYLPALALLLMLMLRGAAIEYAMKSQKLSWFVALAFFSAGIVLIQAYGIMTILADVVHMRWITPQHFLSQSILGFLVYVLFVLQLGLQSLRASSLDRYRTKLLSVFAVAYAGFLFLYQPLHQADISSMLLFLMVLILTERHYQRLYQVLLVAFAFTNLMVVAAYVFPNVFPHKLSYLKAASSTDALSVMIILSLIFLPILFIAITLVKSYFRHRLQDISY